MDMCLGWLLNYANVSCIMTRPRISYWLAVHSGRMKQAEPCFWSSYRNFIMRQGSPYTLSFNRIIRVAQESGIVSKWWQRFHEDAVSLSHKKNTANVSSQLIEMNKRRHRLKNNSYSSVFFLLLVGYVLSLAIFSMELTVKHFHAKLQRRWRRLRRRIVISKK